MGSQVLDGFSYLCDDFDVVGALSLSWGVLGVLDGKSAGREVFWLGMSMVVDCRFVGLTVPSASLFSVDMSGSVLCEFKEGVFGDEWTCWCFDGGDGSMMEDIG